MIDSRPNLSAAPSALRSPFTGHTVGDSPNAEGAVGVKLSASVLPSATLISTWISGLDGLLQALAPVLGDLPQHTGNTVATPLGLLVRSGPEEFLLLGHSTDKLTARLRASVTASVGSVTDLGHARCNIHIEGAQSRAMLNKLFALDLRSSEFPVGEVRLTGTHHVPCMLYRLGDDAFDMIVLSTYAYDQLGTVLDAALEYGVGLTLN